MQTTMIARAALAAEFQAKAALRAGRANDQKGFDRHLAEMRAVITRSRFPVSVAKGLVQLVGRGKAMVLGLPRRIINAALGDDAPLLACHYERPTGSVIRLARIHLTHVERVGLSVGLWEGADQLAVTIDADDEGHAEALADSLVALIGTQTEVEFHDGEVAFVREA